jgi:hypothetical protein
MRIRILEGVYFGVSWSYSVRLGKYGMIGEETMFNTKKELFLFIKDFHNLNDWE